MMTNNNFSVIGLMSGTSLDGLDIAHCIFTMQEGQWRFTLENSLSITYPDALRDSLKQSVDLSAVDLLLLHNDYGRWLGKQVKEFISNREVRVDFVSSHGHTVFHQPDKKLTYQIGSGQALANGCSTKVVCDFRSLDVSLGGQGAPLVPIGDKTLFAEFDFCLNLGGIGNVSFDMGGNRVAYDICPVNMLLNYLTIQVGKAYDKDGEMARTGRVNEALLNDLNNLGFYQLPFPKSLGYEWFCEKVMPVMDKSTATIPDKLCTAVHHIAGQISAGVMKYQNGNPARLLATGGGARNSFLIDTLREHLTETVEVVIPKPEIIDFKEAIVFAFMGVKRMMGEINCLQSVTGAQADSSGGVVYHPC